MTTEQMREYNLSWRIDGARCESTRPRCENKGEGWLLSLSHRPMVLGYYCAEHSERLAEYYARVRTETEFVSGVAVDGFISLDVQWRIKAP